MTGTTTKVTAILCALLWAGAASAGAIRLDSGGDWSLLASGSGDSAPTALGFDMSMFGVTGDTLTVRDDGTASLSGGVSFADFDVLATGSIFEWSIEQTNDDFLQTGIEAGFRVTWSVGADPFAQLAMFQLTDGRHVLEFNYNDTVAGATAGYSTGLGENYDLLAELGLSLADLPLNNSFNGGPPGTDALPAFLDDYFLLDPSFGDPAIGRYLWLSAPEPPVIALFALGGLLFVGVALLRRRAGTNRAD